MIRRNSARALAIAQLLLLQMLDLLDALPAADHILVRAPLHSRGFATERSPKCSAR